VLVYDLGLSAANTAIISSWQGVSVVSVPFDSLPPHVRTLSSFTFKSWAIHHAIGGNIVQGHTSSADEQTTGGRLRDGDAVLWLDASGELRRPLAAEVATALTRGKGHAAAAYAYDQQAAHFAGIQGEGGGVLLTVSGFFFPTPYNVAPQTLDRFGCDKADANPSTSTSTSASAVSTEVSVGGLAWECAGGYQGYVKGGWGHREVLVPLHKCAMDPSCITPPGSGRHNHRWAI
jgi:hypothetical protein